jgi:acyl-CoA synthetase (AMP-forming)/AMP-acid ligase II
VRQRSRQRADLGAKLYYSILFLSIIGAGGVYTGTNPSYTPFELTHHLKTSRARFIIAEPELLGSIKAAARTCEIPESHMWFFNVHGQSVPPTLKSWSELLSHGEDDWIRFNDKQVSRRTPVALLFSSGTTGLPKAAVLSHYNLVAQHTLAVEPQRVPYEVSKRTEAAPLEDTD